MRKVFAAFLVLGAAVSVFAFDMEEEEEYFYAKITSSAEYSYRPEFLEEKYEQNAVLEDVKVGLVQSVPFGFLFSTAYIFLSEGFNQEKWPPDLKDPGEYQGVYYSFIGGLAALSLAVNFMVYYEYGNE
ncbi:MAG TPA: hypothetical protein ENN55_01085 [Firmicutes bacterium]|nr:hypothetical protein [Bacillota bacterium]